MFGFFVKGVKFIHIEFTVFQMKIEKEKQKEKKKQEKKVKQEQMKILGKDKSRPRLSFSLIKN